MRYLCHIIDAYKAQGDLRGKSSMGRSSEEILPLEIRGAGGKSLTVKSAAGRKKESDEESGGNLT